MPSGTELKINTGKMAAVAQAINNQTSIIKSCFNTIRQQSSELRGSCWEGESADVYFENMRKLCSEQSLSGYVTAGYIVQALEEYVLDLNSAASEYDSTERDIESRNQSLPTDVFGI